MPEEEFVPGVDPGVKAWLAMRQAIREARHKGTNTVSVPSDIKYKYQRHWYDELIRVLHNSNNSSGTVTDSNEKDADAVSLAQFTAMLETRDVVPVSIILYRAIHQRNMMYINMVLEAGISIDSVVDDIGRTMLHIAVENGYFEKFNYLLANGARIDLQDNKGRTPLFLSFQTPSSFHPIDIIMRLLDEGADLNCVNYKNQNPLHRACILDNPELIEIAIANGADVSLLDIDDKLAWDYCKTVRVARIFNQKSNHFICLLRI